MDFLIYFLPTVLILIILNLYNNYVMYSDDLKKGLLGITINAMITLVYVVYQIVTFIKTEDLLLLLCAFVVVVCYLCTISIYNIKKKALIEKK